MKNCMMIESVVEAISKESRLAFEKNSETGGILIGPPPTDTAIVITAATGPGPDGKRASYASWETDPDYLNEKLKEMRNENPILNLRGFWHRHPGRMGHPSSQDLMEATRILADIEHYKLGGELIMPIVTATQKQVTIQAYHITSEEPRFIKVPVEVVPDSDGTVKSLLAPRNTNIVEIDKGTDFWHDEDWQFYRSSYGAERLEIELSELDNAGHKAEVKLLDDGNCCIEAWKSDDQRFLFVLPREFPVNPPRVFIKKDNDIREFALSNSSPLSRWSSLYRLAELADVALVEKCYEPNRKGKTRHEILICAREDFRHGDFNISRWIQHLSGLIRGENKCI